MIATKKRELKTVQEQIKKFKFKLPDVQSTPISTTSSLPSLTPSPAEEPTTSITPLVTSLNLSSVVSEVSQIPDTSILDSTPTTSHLDSQTPIQTALPTSSDFSIPATSILAIQTSASPSPPASNTPNDLFDSDGEDDGPPTDFGGKKYIEVDDIELQVVDEESKSQCVYFTNYFMSKSKSFIVIQDVKKKRKLLVYSSSSSEEDIPLGMFYD